MTLGRRSRPWLALGVLGVALSVAAFLIASGVFNQGSDSSTGPEVSAEPAPRLLPAAPTEPARRGTELAPATTGSAPAAGPLPATVPVGPVVLDLESDPDKADVLLDGRMIGKTPFEHEVPRGDRALTIEFRRSGFRSQTRNVIPDGNRKVSISLDRLEHAKAAKGPTGKTGKSAKSGGGKTGKSGGTSGKTGSTSEKPPTKPPVTFVP